MKTLSIINQKGGVGKTTTTINLGAALAEAGRKVLLIDLDPQHSLTKLCGITRPAGTVFDTLIDPAAAPLESVIVPTTLPGVELAPAHRALAGLESALRDVMGREKILEEALEPIQGHYDYILMDNGPQLGIAPAMSLAASDQAIIPLQCERMALEGLSQVWTTLETAQKRVNPRLGIRILLTMLDTRTKDSKEIAEQVRARFGALVYGAAINRSSKLSLSDSNAGSVFLYAPSSPAADAYRALAQEIEGGAHGR